ncbi:MAG: Glyoxalase/Bleomycin resistance protein/Dioxygenase family protein [Gemmatimonadetes bacterium]|nr:Glyoxalase/Bleomycin resistance protein/Dioxygenase family protein [Gemmatimonadota bacterium]
MERVTGIGGIFFKSDDPTALNAWYAANLGIEPDEDAGGSTVFRWRPVGDDATVGMTVWSPFPADTGYFEPTRAPYMVNYRVASLDRMLAQLRAAGVQVDERVEDTDYGRFGWAVDPDGTRFELWEPPAGQ